jgi:hypothetical protein
MEWAPLSLQRPPQKTKTLLIMTSVAQHFQGFGSKVIKFECNVTTVLRVPKSHFTIDSKKLELAMDIAICKLPARGR